MLVVATAGHVDHGKSTLVRALTGTEPDRWAEERRRGLTIDLGYAWTTLPSGRDVAFVDVPGHQRFIANMLAGLGPAPAVVFVVAADEGWRRQSAEHLAAVAALDVRHGLLVVTRSDLADPQPALAQARRRLVAAGLPGWPGVAVSALTGQGLDVLRARLDELADVAASGAPAAGSPRTDLRLWIDRSFSIRGRGTVVTGTLSNSQLNINQPVTVRDDIVATLRGIQSLGVDRSSIDGTARVAVVLRGVTVDRIGRGDALTEPDVWPHAVELDVRLTRPISDTGVTGTGSETPAGRHGTSGPGSDPGPLVAALRGDLVLHVGTAALPVRLRPLGPDTARVTLPRPLPLRAGDRAVLRDPGKQHVAAGVLVLDAVPPALRRRGAAAARALDLVAYTGAPDAALELRRRRFARPAELRRLGCGVSQLPRFAGWLVDPGARGEWAARVLALRAAWAHDHPLDPDPPRAHLARELGVPVEVLDLLLDGALDPAPVEVRGAVLDGQGNEGAATGPTASGPTATGPTANGPTDGTSSHPPANATARHGAQLPAATLGPAEAGVRELEARLTRDPYRAATRDELAELGLDHRVLTTADRRGRLLLLAPGIVLLPGAIDDAARRLAELPQPFTVSDAGHALQSSRRVIVPLVERLDSLGITQRDGDRRTIHARPAAAT